MSNLRNLSVSKKLWLLTFLTAIGLTLSTVFALMEYHDDLMQEKEAKTRSLVESTITILSSYHARAEQGEFSDEEAKQQALKVIKALRYDGENYFWINDMDAKIVMHPIKPKLDGQDLSDFKDPAGKRIFTEFATVVRHKGSGVVPYLWPKPGSEKPVKKLSYVKGFAPWGWVIGTGIYVDDVETALWINARHMGLVSLIILAVLVILAAAITRSVVDPLRKTITAMDDISTGDGDLTLRLDEQGNDEIASLAVSFNQFARKIQQIVISVSQGSAQLAAATTELNATMKQTHDNVVQQQQETAQVATAITEMVATVEEISHSASGAAGSARQADEQALKGKQVVTNVTDAINDLAQEMGAASSVINNLANESDNIGSVLDAIRDIAEQTNLLALNAAIEAARAGEQGRGFAVVADEVRSLASRTQKATLEIRDMIERLQDGSKNAVTVIQHSGDVLGGTVDAANAAKTALESIVNSVASISERNLQIASTSEQQSAVAREIDRSVVQIARLAEQSARASEGVATATHELSTLSDGLQEIISRFKVESQGSLGEEIERLYNKHQLTRNTQLAVS